jgi:hypothetical protein
LAHEPPPACEIKKDKARFSVSYIFTVDGYGLIKIQKVFENKCSIEPVIDEDNSMDDYGMNLFFIHGNVVAIHVKRQPQCCIILLFAVRNGYDQRKADIYIYYLR